tara:strand:- start:425 stop:1006 length:582 start_codon:yes stop_codon:yes gene_type:complete
MLNKINKRYVKLCKKHMKKTKESDCNFLKSQPGLFAGLEDVINSKYYTCKNMDRRLRLDNKHIRKTKKRCKKNEYKGALFVHPKKTYHFYRQDNNKLWSHKDGFMLPTNRDAKRRKIRNIRKSNRKYKPTKKETGVYYSKFCNYYCIPKSKRKKFFSAYTRNKKRKTKRKTNRKIKRRSKSNKKRRKNKTKRR